MAAIVTLRALTLVIAAHTAHMALPAVFGVSPLICLQVFIFFFMEFVQTMYRTSQVAQVLVLGQCPNK